MRNLRRFLNHTINSDNIKYKPIPGAIPELVLFDGGDKVSIFLVNI